MNKTLLRFFKIWICFIPSIIFWFISHPFNIIFMCIPEGIYWFITAGRSLMDDSDSFSNWTTNLK